MIVELGSFQVDSGTLVVSDPCFELNSVPVMGVLEHVANGKWNGQIQRVEVSHWGEVCSKLFAYHQSFADRTEALQWFRCQFIVGVDSGQAGIFDIKKYRKCDTEGQEQTPDADSDWYLACCDITECDHEAGVLDGGVVSRSGIGDGGYQAFAARNEEEQIVGVKLVFIREDIV